jgi:hypothetical protein
MAHRPRHENDVAGAPSEDLVGDVDAAALDVARPGPRRGVAFGVPGGPVVKPGVLAQDASFELAQLRTRLDTELPDQHGAQLAVCPQRIGLPPAAVQRQQALEPEPLAQRMICGQHLELGDHLSVPPALKQRIHPQLHSTQAHLLEPRPLRCGEFNFAEVGEHGPAPQRQRLVKHLGGRRGVSASQCITRGADELVESQDVQLISRGPELIARRTSGQPIRLPDRPKRPAQLSEAHPQVGQSSLPA